MAREFSLRLPDLNRLVGPGAPRRPLENDTRLLYQSVIVMYGGLLWIAELSSVSFGVASG